MSPTVGVRRIRVSKQLIETVLVSGPRCCYWPGAPDDLQVISATDVPDDLAVELLVASKQFADTGEGEPVLIQPIFLRMNCDQLAAAIKAKDEEIEKLKREARAGYDPLPLCRHGKPLVDGGGERLEPSCGCRWEP